MTGAYPEEGDGAAVHWLELGSQRLRCVCSGADDAPPVLLFPGWGCTSYSFRGNLPALAAAGFRAISVELPGQGWSDKPTGEDSYSLQALARAAIQVLDELRIERAPLIGASLGGAIALQIALASLQRVTRIVLWSPIGFGCSPLVHAAAQLPLSLSVGIERLAGRQLVRVLLRLVYGGDHAPHPRDVEQYELPIHTPRFVWSQMALLRNVRWDQMPPSELARLTLPITIVTGTKDPLVPIGRLADAAATLADGRLCVVRGAGHAANETHPGQINGETLAALRVPDALPTS